MTRKKVLPQTSLFEDNQFLTNHSFLSRKDGRLQMDGIDICALAASVGTPVYLYSLGHIEDRFRTLRTHFTENGLQPLIAYAVKANDTLAILSRLGALGAGADVVSGGEIIRAIRAGIPADRIVFSGVGKTAEEHRLSIELGVRQINVESVQEFQQVHREAESLGKSIAVAFRINPDVDANTHKKITTGKNENKFGMPIEHAVSLIPILVGSSFIKFSGLSLHIGSQIMEVEPFVAAFKVLGKAIEKFRSLGLNVQNIDLGGGFGISYEHERDFDMSRYVQAAAEFARTHDVELIIEPGRWLVGQAGILIAKRIFEKRNREKRFIVVDAGMNDLIRPAFYDAYHKIIPVCENGASYSPADVVGPICESSDVLGRGRPLPDQFDKDGLLAVMDVGAYGASMSSSYNTRRTPAGVLTYSGRWALVRRRPRVEEIIGLDADHLAWINDPMADPRHDLDTDLKEQNFQRNGDHYGKF